ncbi:hypothetical protein GUITHDRAFT_155604 [Guillardia theta CCMP2712]|uniref:Uncharacterized protein n=1 Tax=Guillardia theta (strain CCMP2712) TaxID=905079 RepID=L1IGM3_GUITC|nr:hypothetical protein GUITHDRAFT_155604 [Guillardia theta CCMP2712]EKX34980.1 hypothetical protein GUITHDRAFT_155604 [Guillardia theta CCMP2712]|eukprot:XP_005821960.1 hypothetical protein GUITHDRAFT_155604 [Guillardia theta CCMP2712]
MRRQINQAWEQYLDEQRLRDPPEGSDGSEAEDDPWEEGGIRERAGGQRADDGETQIRDRTLNGDREIKGQDGKQSNGEESDEAEGSSDSNKYLDESADSDGLHHKSKFDEVHQSSTTKEEFKVSIDMLRRKGAP